MMWVFRAEPFRLIRRRTVLVTAAGGTVFSVVAALTVFSTAQESGVPSRRAGTTQVALAGAGGGTEAFAVGGSFVGFLVFVIFIALLGASSRGGHTELCC